MVDFLAMVVSLEGILNSEMGRRETQSIHIQQDLDRRQLPPKDLYTEGLEKASGLQESPLDDSWTWTCERADSMTGTASQV